MRNFIFPVLLFSLLFISCERIPGGGNKTQIIDHTCIDITQLSEDTIKKAKDNLIIAYWHTSHGSQLTTGMAGLDNFLGDTGLYDFNSTGQGGALELMEPRSTDIGKGQGETWEPWTREFLENPDNADVNVIIWSWCGQVSGASEEYISTYLNRMNQLELDYPDIIFIYMTGHSDGTGLDGNLHERNMQIRNYCELNNKWLYDFYDIECYDPDGNYFGDKYVTDSCGYDGGNWAVEWQDDHQDEWYNCSSAHSQPLNANLKAYAAWRLWVEISR